MCDFEIHKDNKNDILNKFMDIAKDAVNNRTIINKNFQKSSYAKNMKLLARGILPKEYKKIKRIYNNNEHMDYITEQIEHKKTLKIRRRISHVN